MERRKLYTRQAQDKPSGSPDPLSGNQEVVSGPTGKLAGEGSEEIVCQEPKNSKNNAGPERAGWIASGEEVPAR